MYTDSKRRLKDAALATIVGIGSILAWPSVALASCGVPPPFPRAIRDAPAVFVGVVVDVSGSGRWATVEITEVWTGDELPTEVEVRGGPGAENVATSVDRQFEISREYLFVPYRKNGSVFRDNACTRTTLFRPELSRFRPAGAGEPSPTPSPGSGSPDVDESEALPWLVVGGALAGSALIALVMLRHR